MLGPEINRPNNGSELFMGQLNQLLAIYSEEDSTYAMIELGVSSAGAELLLAWLEFNNVTPGNASLNDCPVPFRYNKRMYLGDDWDKLGVNSLRIPRKPARMGLCVIDRNDPSLSFFVLHFHKIGSETWLKYVQEFGICFKKESKMECFWNKTCIRQSADGDVKMFDSRFKTGIVFNQVESFCAMAKCALKLA